MNRTARANRNTRIFFLECYNFFYVSVKFDLLMSISMVYVWLRRKKFVCRIEPQVCLNFCVSKASTPAESLKM